jgi:hypothetical protein
MCHNNEIESKKLTEKYLRGQFHDKEIVLESIKAESDYYFQIEFSANTQKIVQFFKTNDIKQEFPAKVINREIHFIESPELFKLQNPTNFEMKLLAWSLINLKEEELREKEIYSANSIPKINKIKRTGNLSAVKTYEEFESYYLDEKKKFLPDVENILIE